MRRRTGPSLALAAIALGGCGGGDANRVSTTPAAHGPGVGRPPVVIGNEDFTEQRILGQLYTQALRAQGFRVRLRPDLPDARAADRALSTGQIDGYPEYLGTILRTVAQRGRTPRGEPATYRAVRGFEAARGLQALAPTPFARADAIAVTAAYARAHALTAIPGLAGLGAFRLGADPNFDRRPSGLPALRRAYGLPRLRFQAVSQGAQYAALDAGRVQAAVVTTTDPRLRSARYVVLADPKAAFGAQNVAPIFSRAALAAAGPAFTRTIDAVSARLTTRVVRRLNASVEVDKRDPADVAHRFLSSHRLA